MTEPNKLRWEDLTEEEAARLSEEELSELILDSMTDPATGDVVIKSLDHEDLNNSSRAPEKKG
jgi:hypothetical protein